MGSQGSKRSLSNNELIEKSLKKALKKNGRNLDGKLTKNDLRELFWSAFDLELSDYETRILFSVGKHDSLSRIDFNEFLKIACAHSDAKFDFDVKLFCKNIFNDIDSDGNGQISLDEFKEASEILPGILRLFKANNTGKISKREFEILFNSKLNFSEKEMELFFHSLDSNANGLIDFSEFLKLLRHDFEVDNKAYAKILFRMYDKNRDGSISLEEYRSMIQMDPSSDYTEDEIMEEFEQIDTDHNGEITLNELIQTVVA